MLDTASPQAIAQALQPTPVAPELPVSVTPKEPLLTTDQLAVWLTKIGYRITPRYLGKLSTPLINRGPPVFCTWGSRKLFKPSEALVWAKNRCKPYSPEAA
jgi:hypothetical protein